MVRKGRQSGSRSWVPGLLAAFWVLLAGFSGTYLYRIVTGEAVEGSEIDHVGAILNEAEPDALSPEQAAALLKFADVQRKELSALKTSLRDLSQQVADLSKQNDALNSRLKPLEKIFGAPSGGGAVTTSPPAPPAIATLNSSRPTESAEPDEKPEEAEAAAPAEPPTQGAPEPLAETPTAQAQAPDELIEGTEPEETPAAQASEDEDSTEAPPPAVTSTGESSEASPEETEVAAVRPALDLPPGTTRFGIELGIVEKREGLRPLWREMLNNHAALVAGLQARRVLAPDKKWRLIAGPFASAEEAIQACVLFKRANRSCEATVFAGDAL